MKYLKKFQINASYEATKSELILPNVSLTVDNNTVHYNPLPIVDGHKYVKIGNIKWATMNIGANSVTDGGLYFQWGDTQGYTREQCGEGEGKKSFNWANYKYATNVQQTNADMTKYNSTDGKTVLEASDDAVQANWGGNWRMPTTKEYVALGNAVNTVWTVNYQGTGVAGLVCADKNDSSKVLFFPACGYCSVIDITRFGGYWSSSLDSSYVKGAHLLFFDNDNVNWQNSNHRFDGYPVRGVYDV